MIAATPRTRSCQTARTPLMLLVHLVWMVYGWRKAARRKAAEMCRAFLERCLRPEVCTLDALKGSTGRSRGSGCSCEDSLCFRGRVTELEQKFGQGRSPQEGLLSCMSMLVVGLPGCCWARAALRSLLGLCEAAVLEFLESGAVQVPGHRAPVRSCRITGRRLGAEDTYRRHAMRTALRERKTLNGKAGMRNDGYSRQRHLRWVHREVRAYAMACQRAFRGHQTGTWAVFEDACRLGNPACETVVYVAFGCHAGCGAALPPQAAGPGSRGGGFGEPSSEVGRSGNPVPRWGGGGNPRGEVGR